MKCSVQFSHSVVSNFVTPWTAPCQVSLSITNSWSLPKLMPIELVMPSSWSAIQLSHPLLSPSPLVFNLSQHQGLFQRVSSSHLKYWNFRIIPSNECSGLISFRIDWLNLLAVQGTLKSLLQHHSSKASVIQCSQPSLWSDSHIHT